MMEAVNTSETSVNFYETTRRNIPEDSHLHIRHRENIKSHKMFLGLFKDAFSTPYTKVGAQIPGLTVIPGCADYRDVC
jgi:hypothetical protein